MTFGILKLTSLMMGNQSVDESNPVLDVYEKKESERYQIPAIEEEKTTARMGQPLFNQRINIVSESWHSVQIWWWPLKKASGQGRG